MERNFCPGDAIYTCVHNTTTHITIRNNLSSRKLSTATTQTQYVNRLYARTVRNIYVYFVLKLRHDKRCKSFDLYLHQLVSKSIFSSKKVLIGERAPLPLLRRRVRSITINSTWSLYCEFIDYKEIYGFLCMHTHTHTRTRV